MQLGSLCQILPILGAIGIGATAAPLTEQNPPAPGPASAIEAAMKATGYTYKEIPGFYSLSLSFQDTKRRQTVYIRRTTDTYNSLKVNEVFALVYDDPQPPSSELLLTAFQKRYSVGGLVLEKPSEEQKNWRIRFKMEHFTSSTTDRLKEEINIVGSTGDFIEKELGPEKGDIL